MEKTKGQPRTIDCTPTWSSILPILLASHEEHAHKTGVKSQQVIENNRKQFQQMAEICDRYNEAVKTMRSMRTEVIKSFEVLIKIIENPALQAKYYKEISEIKFDIHKFHEAEAASNKAKSEGSN